VVDVGHQQRRLRHPLYDSWAASRSSTTRSTTTRRRPKTPGSASPRASTRPDHYHHLTTRAGRHHVGQNAKPATFQGLLRRHRSPRRSLQKSRTRGAHGAGEASSPAARSGHDSGVVSQASSYPCRTKPVTSPRDSAPLNIRGAPEPREPRADDRFHDSGRPRRTRPIKGDESSGSSGPHDRFHPRPHLAPHDRVGDISLAADHTSTARAQRRSGPALHSSSGKSRWGG
jgi:hypothetical protein